MKSTFFSGVMAGAYIALGAMTFLIIPNQHCSNTILCHRNFSRIQLQ